MIDNSNVSVPVSIKVATWLFLYLYFYLFHQGGMNRDTAVGGFEQGTPLLPRCHGTNKQDKATGWPADSGIRMPAAASQGTAKVSNS